MLVTERGGQMRIVGADGTVGAPLSGLPTIHADGQGGLLDVVLDRLRHHPGHLVQLQ
jgi:glucose/arabinose dehydrogenase